MKELELPEMIFLEEFGGNFDVYNEAVYEIFKEGFVSTKPTFGGVRLRLKRYPLVNGKEYTYYHFTHSGNIETKRIPDMRRMERMPFPRPMIDASDSTSLKVWRNKRGTKERILILHEEERYLVVLEDRRDYILPWTAYYIECNNKIRRLLREYVEYHNRI